PGCTQSVSNRCYRSWGRKYIDNGLSCFFFQAEDGIRDGHVTGVQTCALPISGEMAARIRLKTLALLGQLRRLQGDYVRAENELRSEERRVGKECRHRWWQDQ